jgi:hypothetical protein
MTTAKKPADAGQEHVQSAFEAAQEQGYFGVKVDPTPNSAHSLESGPSAPSVLEQNAIGLEQRAEAARKPSTKKEA